MRSVAAPRLNTSEIAVVVEHHHDLTVVGSENRRHRQESRAVVFLGRHGCDRTVLSLRKVTPQRPVRLILGHSALSAYLNGWSGKATGDEPINGWLVRRSGVGGAKRPRDGEGEGDGDGGSADGEGEGDDGTMTPHDKGDIGIMDEKEEESKEGKRNTGSLDAQDDDGDARPTGRLDSATPDGRTVPGLREMCRQVHNEVFT